MTGLILFAISFCLVFISSYFIAAIFKSKRTENTIIFLILTIFSQVILTTEVLSIFKQINPIGMISLNFLVFISSFFIWIKKNKPKLEIRTLKNIYEKIKRAINSDKALMALFVFFMFSLIITIFFVFLVPTNSWDSHVYRLARVALWIQNQTLEHFNTTSVRQIIFPINAEILTLWPMVFVKRDYLASINEFFAYLGSLFVLFSFLSYLKISVKRTIWSVLLLASLPALIIEASSTQINLIMGFLLFSSLYLYIYSVRENENKSLVYSAIALSIAIGIKTSVFFAMPALGISYLLIAIKSKGKNFYKPILKYSLIILPCILIFSAYNYILNFLDFGHPIGTKAIIAENSLEIGINALITNFIRYLFMFIDFSGIETAKYYSPLIISFKQILFTILGLKASDGLAYNDVTTLNTLIHENYSTYGILGFLLIVPLSIKYGLFKTFKNNQTSFYIAKSCFIFIGFWITISALMGFNIYNVRYLTAAIIIASPVLAYSYTPKKSILKIIIVLIAIYNFIVISLFNSSKPFFPVVKDMLTKNYQEFRQEIRLKDEKNYNMTGNYYKLLKFMAKEIPENSKIALVFSDNDNYYPFFEENLTWKIFPVRYNYLQQLNSFNEYDYLIFSGYKQTIEVLHETPDFTKYIAEGNSIFFKNSNDKIMTYYLNRDSKAIKGGTPVFMTNYTDFSKLPQNIKLIKEISANSNKKFFVFKVLN